MRLALGLLTVAALALLLYWFFRPWGNGPVSGPDGNSYGGTIAFGHHVSAGVPLRSATSDAVVDHIRLGGAFNLRVIGAYAARYGTPGGNIGLEWSYPPRVGYPSRRLQPPPLLGHRLPSGPSLLVLGLAPTRPGNASYRSIRLDYHVGWRHYRATYELPLSLCVTGKRIRCRAGVAFYVH